MCGTSLLALAPSVHAQPPGIADQTTPTHTYTELSITNGAGSTSSGKRAGEENELVIAINALLLNRHGNYVGGANVNVQTSLFSTDHIYLGGVFGFVVGGDRAHLELLGEAGFHHLSSMGADLFSPAPAQGSNADIPYAGTQLRAVFDLGEPNGLQLELTAHGRSDLSREQRDLHVKTCFLSCSTKAETWTVGGASASVLAGLSYQFE